jgi:hypothetical protein
MAAKPSTRVIRAVSEAMWKRDQLQMRAVDALLSLGVSRRKRAPSATRRRPAKRKP